MENGMTGTDKKYNFETPPDTIPENEITADINAEVIVIGAGTAGLVCATAAVENGAKVVVISKSEAPVARGGSNFAFNTRATRKAGISLNISKIYKQLMLISSYRVDQDKWWLFARKSGEAMDWLCDKMEAAGYKTVLNMNYEDPDGVISTYPGEHGWVGNGITASAISQPAVVNLLAKSLKTAGVQIDYKTSAVQLVRGDKNRGRVAAVIARRSNGKYVRYRGLKAIVLATGDFGADAEMVAKYCPWALQFPIRGIYPGDGHKMALWIGAAWQKTVPNAPMINLPPVFGATPALAIGHLGLIVNKNGIRFANEDTLGATSAIAQARQPEMKAFAIWNAKYAERAAPWPGDTYGAEPKSVAEIVARWDSLARGFSAGTQIRGTSVPKVATVKAGTLEELAEKLALPIKTLKATIKRYNGFCQSGIDEDFGKRRSLLIPIDEGPFYGSYSIPSALIITGGLLTNTKFQVLDDRERVIPGLYAVGTISGDMFGNIYTFMLPGHNLGANCVTFGYLAGKGIAGEK
jgi:fumarate reductase flavoprotein subunit